MAWTSPTTWAAAAVVTAAQLNTHLRDNITYLKDILDGVQNQTVQPTYAATDANGQLLYLRKARNTAAAPAIVASGDAIGRIHFSAYDGAAYQEAASIRAAVDTTPGANDMPGRLSIYVTPDGSATPAEALRIASDATYGKQLLASAATTGAIQYAFLSDSNTGIGSQAADGITFYVAGNSRWFMENSLLLYGQTTPWLYSSGSALAAMVGSATPLVADRQNNDGTVISIRQDTTEEGTISVSGTTVSYNAFMGSHYTQLKPGQPEPPVGGVVIATGEIVAGESDGAVKDYMPHVAATTVPGDSRVYGVWFAKLSDSADGMSFGMNALAVYQVAALGLYKVRVTDTGGDIATGDLLETSKRPYEAQRADGTEIASSTLGKALVDVNWNTVPVDLALGYKWQLVPAVLYAG